MKPLSEQDHRDTIIHEQLLEILMPTFKASGYGVQKLDEAVSQIEEIILSDRKAWGEYVIGTSSLSMVMSPAIRLKNGHIDTSWTDEHDKYKAAYIEDRLRAEQRQRNQG